MPMNGTITPPKPWINKFLRSNALASICMYGASFSANGISNGIMMR